MLLGELLELGDQRGDVDGVIGQQLRVAFEAPQVVVGGEVDWLQVLAECIQVRAAAGLGGRQALLLRAKRRLQLVGLPYERVGQLARHLRQFLQKLGHESGHVGDLKGAVARSSLLLS